MLSLEPQFPRQTAAEVIVSQEIWWMGQKAMRLSRITDCTTGPVSWRTTLLWSTSYYSQKFFLVLLWCFCISPGLTAVCLWLSLVSHFPVYVEGNFILCVIEAIDVKSGLTSFSLIANLSANHSKSCWLYLDNTSRHSTYNFGPNHYIPCLDYCNNLIHKCSLSFYFSLYPSTKVRLSQFILLNINQIIWYLCSELYNDFQLHFYSLQE